VIGWLAPRPAPAAWCHHCWSNGEYDAVPPGRFKHPAGSFYCFICDDVSTDECAFGWLSSHSQHVEPDDEFYCEERVRLRSGSGIYAWIPGDHAERYRPPAYVDLLERWEWDEARAPRSLVAHAAEYTELLALVQAVVDDVEHLALEVAGPSPAIEDALLRVLRSPRRLRTWRARLGGIGLVFDVLRAAAGDAARPARGRLRWPPPPPAPTVVCDTRCSMCGALTAPYGPPPHTCARCVTRRVWAPEGGEA
jgi:hypothetical protein